MFNFGIFNYTSLPSFGFKLPMLGRYSFTMPILGGLGALGIGYAATKYSFGGGYDFNFGSVSTPCRQVASVESASRKKSPSVTSKPKVTKSNLGNNIVAEEVIPGSPINKGKYINLVKLKPDMKQILVDLDKKAKELGYTMVVIDGFRTHEQQREAKKRKPKLCATPGKSAHEYGAAVDLAMYKDGKQISIDKIPEFARYAQSLGLEWGATWRSKYEPWHFNFNKWQARADICDEYNAWNGKRNYA